MDIFMSHDVDWPKTGPGRDHILARSERFDYEIISKVKSEDFNPYFGIPQIVDIEKRLGVKSTFFFRPMYDNGQTVEIYREELEMLRSSGWEVGLHTNNAKSLESLLSEKEVLENVLNARVLGTRAHYLKIASESLRFFNKAGFLYDSSTIYSKDKFDLRNTGTTVLEGGLLVFPITFMDAYLFTYTKLDEQNLLGYVLSNIESAMESGVNLVTILWHDNVIYMRGGRLYRTLLEKLLDIDKISIVRGIDAYNSRRNERESWRN